MVSLSMGLGSPRIAEPGIRKMPSEGADDADH
jgi:hypothetical protein